MDAIDLESVHPDPVLDVPQPRVGFAAEANEFVLSAIDQFLIGPEPGRAPARCQEGQQINEGSGLHVPTVLHNLAVLLDFVRPLKHSLFKRLSARLGKVRESQRAIAIPRRTSKCSLWGKH